MGIRDHGYYGYAFVGVRPCQMAALSAVIGIIGRFLSDDRHAHIAAPGQLVGTLVIACVGLLWTLLSLTAYDDSHFPYFVTSAVDLVFMVPFIVIAAVLGGPLGGVDCSVLPVVNASNAHAILAVQMSGGANATAPSSYIFFVGDNQTTCFEIMAVWGLVIALCVLFSLSGFATGLLFLGHRRLRAAERAAQQAAAPSAGPINVYAAPGNDSEIEMARGGKWAEDDDDDRSSMHGRFRPDLAHGMTDIPMTPAYPSAGGRTLHPRLSPAVGASE